MNRKIVMISQPMAGIDKDTVIETRKSVKYKLLNDGYKVKDTFVSDNVPSGVKHRSIWYLAKSIEHMSDVDAVYFCNGWKKARGCVIENIVARAYGLECIYEDSVKELILTR